MSDSSDMVVGQESGRAPRARTRLIVEGFSNLALVAILFTGVQAQLVSVTNADNENKLAIATNAVFFGGLIFSVFTTMLATLAGRWFSILREDDSDYLSSCWLAQDCEELGDTKPNLEKYLEYQIKLFKEKLAKEGPKSRPLSQSEHGTTKANSPTSGTTAQSPKQETDRRQSSAGDGAEPEDPVKKDLERIIWLLQAERERPLHDDEWPKDHKSAKCVTLKPGPTTRREHILSWTLLSALAASVAAFLLFCAGILLLAWNRQPRAVAIFTSATVLVCIVPLACFFLRHRHKHVIKHLHLARPGF